MKLFLYLSDFIVPFLILAIIVYGILMGTNVYDNFIKGARSGFLTVIKIMPTLIGLMVAVGILRASGFLEFFARLIGKITLYIGFPGELVPLTLVKMFSSSAATGLLLDIFKEYGTDSRLGLIASISMSCTETIFYTMSVYFMTAKVTKTRYTLPALFFPRWPVSSPASCLQDGWFEQFGHFQSADLKSCVASFQHCRPAAITEHGRSRVTIPPSNVEMNPPASIRINDAAA